MTASACIQWIRDELEAHDDLKTLHPPLVDTESLCEFVTDGRALCLLANVALPGEENELPKKLQRSLKQLSKFHALERVQFFIKWCRTRAKLEEHQVFTTVQLLDEVNEVAVSETIIALRNKTRPGLKSYCFNGNKSTNAIACTSTTSSTSTGSSNANNANRLSSFLNKFPSAPVVATTTSQTKPLKRHNRVSLTSSVTSSNPSPRDFDEPVPVDEINNNSSNSSSNKSRLCIPSIFKGNKNASLTLATSRSSVISNASSTASSNKEEGHESRSWSSKLSAFSRHSSLSNVSAPKTPSPGDLDSSDTPSSSPVASPHNRVSIPSVFSAPSPAAPKSMSKLSAFLSSVDATAPATPALNAHSEDKQTTELVAEATPEEDVKPAVEVDQAEEEEPPIAIAEEILCEKESMNMGVEAENKPLKEPVSSVKLLAFLQAVEPGSTTLPKQEVSEEEEDEGDFVEVNAEAKEVVPAEKEALAFEEEVAPVEDEVAETESEVSDVEVELAATPKEKEPTEEKTVPEMHDELAMETQETSEEEVEEIPDDETPERQEAEATAPVVEVAPVSPEILQENERLLAENDALTQKLETAETAVATKDTELEAVKQKLELLKTQLAEEQARAHNDILAAEKKQEVLAADAAEARAELAKLQQTSSESASTAKEAKAAKAQMEELAVQNKSLMADLTNLREEVQTLEQSVQLARDSEEAARYAAQVAFAARDSADEVNLQLKNQLAQLEK